MITRSGINVLASCGVGYGGARRHADFREKEIEELNVVGQRWWQGDWQISQRAWRWVWRVCRWSVVIGWKGHVGRRIEVD